MEHVVDTSFDPENQNRITQLAAEHFEKSLRLIISNLFPRGYGPGQEPERNTLKSLLHLIQVHDRNVAVIMDPQELPGNQARANMELLQEAKLREQVFGEAVL